MAMKPQSLIDTVDAPIDLDRARNRPSSRSQPCSKPRNRAEADRIEGLDDFCEPSAVDGLCLHCGEQVAGYYGAYHEALVTRLRDAIILCEAGQHEKAVAELGPVIHYLSTQVALRSPGKSATHEVARHAMRAATAIQKNGGR